MPQKSHTEFLKLKIFHKGLNAITQKVYPSNQRKIFQPKKPRMEDFKPQKITFTPVHHLKSQCATNADCSLADR